jgi:hypothetical protein
MMPGPEYSDSFRPPGIPRKAYSKITHEEFPPMYINSLKSRYERDPVFQNLVDLFRSLLEKQDPIEFTPTEVREAATLATMMYEFTHIRPIVMNPLDWRTIPLNDRDCGPKKESEGLTGP